MRAAVLLLLLAGCAAWRPAEYRPLGDSGVEATFRQVGPPEFVPGGVMVCAREVADHLTSRCIIVKERGVTMEGKVNLSAELR